MVSGRGGHCATAFTTAHLVPGIEYRVSSSVDFVGEIGIGLNDGSSNYISAGIAYYVR